MAPARPQHPERLRDSALRPGEMQHAEGAGDGIETPIREGQGLGVALAERGLGEVAPCLFHHGGGEIHAGCPRAAPGGQRRAVSRARRHVQYIHAGLDAGGVEHRSEAEARRVPGDSPVAGGLPVPTRALERLEGVRVEAHAAASARMRAASSQSARPTSR